MIYHLRAYRGGLLPDALRLTPVFPLLGGELLLRQRQAAGFWSLPAPVEPGFPERIGFTRFKGSDTGLRLYLPHATVERLDAGGAAWGWAWTRETALALAGWGLSLVLFLVAWRLVSPVALSLALFWSLLQLATPLQFGWLSGEGRDHRLLRRWLVWLVGAGAALVVAVRFPLDGFWLRLALLGAALGTLLLVLATVGLGLIAFLDWFARGPGTTLMERRLERARGGSDDEL